MKHIFSVHSPITFLVAYATIKHLDLKKEDVIILSVSYKVPIDEYKVIPSFYEAKNKSFWQRIKYFNVPRAFDNYINQYLDNENFIAYVDLMSYFQKILISHHKCTNFHFIEEGNGSYQTTDDINDIVWDEKQMSWRAKGLNNLKTISRIIRGYNLKLLSLPYIYTAYSNTDHIKFFAFSNNAYNCVSSKRRIIVKPNIKDDNYRKLSSGYVLENASIWMDGSNSRYTGLDESYYHNAIKKAIPILIKKGVIKDKVYVKLRPRLQNVSENKLVNILKKHHLSVEVMPDNIIIESFLVVSKNCNVIGVMTSTLEYAHVFGHKAYSIYGLFEKQTPTFIDRMTGYWENIENLKE